MANREILFRGNNGSGWIYGWFCGACCRNVFAKAEKGSWIIDGNLNWFEVIPETVWQFTGFVDKNGTKIFEGDIVTLFDEKSVVKTSEMRASFGLYKISNGMFYEMIHKNDQKWLEVVGNIYDNPELLEDK
jgi:vacuolar-type H+-ATPase catalytic subunit A/Vma1